MIFISSARALAISYSESIATSALNSHRFRYTITYSLKLSIEHCGQIAADGGMVTIDSL